MRKNEFVAHVVIVFRYPLEKRIIVIVNNACGRWHLENRTSVWALLWLTGENSSLHHHAHSRNVTHARIEWKSVTRGVMEEVDRLLLIQLAFALCAPNPSTTVIFFLFSISLQLVSFVICHVHFKPYTGQRGGERWREHRNEIDDPSAEFKISYGRPIRRKRNIRGTYAASVHAHRARACYQRISLVSENSRLIMPIRATVPTLWSKSNSGMTTAQFPASGKLILASSICRSALHICGG